MGAKTGPPANRRLDFDGGNVRKSIENLSPFKPRRALRRSMGGHDVGSQDVFAEVEMPTSTETIAEEGDGGSAGFGDADVEDDAAIVTDDLDQDEGASVMPTLPLTAPSQRPRRFEDVETKARPQSQSSRPSSSGSNSSRQHKATSSKKRDRQSLESEHIAVSVVDSTVVHDQEPQSSPSRARKRSKTRPSDALSILAEEEELQEEDQSARTIDPSNLKFNATLLSDDALPDNAEDDDDDPRDAFPSPTPIPEPAPKTKRAAKAKAPSRKGRAHSTPAKPTASRGSASPSKQRPEGRGVSAGPSSTYALRATTPFEDATTRSRSGRNVIKPLQYWANESRIYRHGEIEGIVRANEVNIPKRRSNGAGTKKGKKVLGKRLDELERRLESIEEEEGGSGDAAYISEDRDVIERDEWEETLGVLAGSVARWDSATQTAVPITSDEDLVQEDLAFAAPSIATRPVASGLFNYAKILTMPFFGAGLVEVPPGGFKRAKNSRKMQMVFFVHEGKVTVEVGVGGGREGTVFAIAKGGCWSVPRGEFDASDILLSSAFPILLALRDSDWPTTRMSSFRPACCTSHSDNKGRSTHRYYAFSVSLQPARQRCVCNHARQNKHRPRCSHRTSCRVTSHDTIHASIRSSENPADPAPPLLCDPAVDQGDPESWDTRTVTMRRCTTC